MQVITADNLEYMKMLRDQGEKFDLIEFDGPYMAGLEDWDNLTEGQYVDHYAARLEVARDLLKPYGVLYLFGYPEGCAEIKVWARRTGTLQLRRWITWYKRITAHKGRKVENILLFIPPIGAGAASEFSKYVRTVRKAMGITISEAMRRTDIHAKHAGRGGGYLWFENGQSLPTKDEYLRMKAFFSIPDDYDYICKISSYEGITDLDFISKNYPEPTSDLNDAGLRSKPVGLYLDLFGPIDSGMEYKKALIVYGGSGNAAIAAEALGYDTTVIERDSARCEVIRAISETRVKAWKAEVNYKAGTLQPSIFQVAKNPDQIPFSMEIES